MAECGCKVTALICFHQLFLSWHIGPVCVDAAGVLTFRVQDPHSFDKLRRNSYARLELFCLRVLKVLKIPPHKLIAFPSPKIVDSMFLREHMKILMFSISLASEV